jgi:hypothetical protein
MERREGTLASSIRLCNPLPSVCMCVAVNEVAQRVVVFSVPVVSSSIQLHVNMAISHYHLQRFSLVNFYIKTINDRADNV